MKNILVQIGQVENTDQARESPLSLRVPAYMIGIDGL